MIANKKTGLNYLAFIVAILTPTILGCSTINDIFKKNYSLSAVSSFPDDINKLKKTWFFCEQCFRDKLCESSNVKQCIDITIPSRNEALNLAVGRANTEAVHFLIDVANTDINGAFGIYQETPLIVAAYYGTKKHQDIASFLISRGADIDKIYPAVGRTPLGVAIWKHNIDFAKLLIKNGAITSIEDDGFRYHFACLNAIKNNLPELFPFIPDCCSVAFHDLNVDPNIAPTPIIQCQNIKLNPEKKKG